MKAPVSKEIISSEINQMMAEAKGDFHTAIENLMIEAGYSSEFLRAKQAMRRKQEAEVKATAPKENEGVEKKETSTQLAQRLSERATIDNIEDDESSGDTEADL